MSENNITLTQDELNQMLQIEGDKRVTSALETAKSKWKLDQDELLNKTKADLMAEMEKKAKLSAEELAKQEYEEQLNKLSATEKELNKRANSLDARDMLNSAEIPKNHYEKFIDILVTDNSKSTKSNVENFISMFSDTKNEIESKIKSELSKIPAPKGQGGGEGAVKKSDFDKMTYSEKMKFKETHPEEFKKFIK